jgi:2-dehydro-3-deoxyphosphogluconate aldolase / (4S)-4-hydroxy-2-oxoglutarate aldolase
MPLNIRDIAGLSPVIPELSVTDIAHAIPLARALSEGGLRVLEISMRSPVATACIEALRKAVPDVIVGAAALTRAVDFAAADRAGAQFGTTPGLTPELAAASRGARFPVMPGVMTPTEMISARNAGFNVLKFFPAGQAAGIDMLRSCGVLFPDLVFSASGGITEAMAKNYLALPNVVSVGGSWIIPPAMLSGNDWLGIAALAREAAILATS